jgi:hypothetical protein
MSTTTIRERIGASLLRTGTELAIDQRELEDRLAARGTRDAAFSSVQGAVMLARWTDSALLWLAWRVHPRTFAPRA